jgi:dolichol-phosphate mannosyltransferase
MSDSRDAESPEAKRTPDVSIIVPALNEQATIEEVVQRLIGLDLSHEVIVVDDGSTDDTPAILERYQGQILAFRNPDPGGKGKAIRAGLTRATGKVVIIQDADLEYRPEEIRDVVAPILGGQADAVYGSRFTKGLHPSMAFANKVVNLLLALMSRVLYGQRISDEATCYKAFRRELLTQMSLTCERFEFCPEVTAKVSRLGVKIAEVPISYEPRSVKAGKKIRWTDGVEAIWTLIRFRTWKP